MRRDFTMTMVLISFLVGIGGSHVSLWSQEDRARFEITPHHIGISVPDLDASIAWYQTMLGFEVVRRGQRQNASDTVIALLRRDDCYIELFEIPGAARLPEYRRDPSADLRVHGTKHFAFQVADALAAAEDLRARGAEIAMGPVDNPRAIFFFVRDNSGNTFELIEYKTP
jgi:methylmalonyl-CoA/ethylmalonyl-CoA epimerase